MIIPTSKESHIHSLKTLNILYEHDDFMGSIASVLDLGCGEGLDLEWWATRTTRDEAHTPLNIRCAGIDLTDQLAMAHKYPNINYQHKNFEDTITPIYNSKFDVLWCHDSFQYCINPLATLANWSTITSDGGMLALIVPQTTNITQRQLAFTQFSGCYYHYTLVNLIHMLAVSGWDCSAGYFLKSATDPWIHAIVYKSTQGPLDPQTTSWYDLVDKKLLPETVSTSIMAHGHLRQQDLVLPWVDHSLSWLGKQ